MKLVLTIAVVGGLCVGAVVRSQAQSPPALENPPAGESPMGGASGSSNGGLSNGGLYGTPGDTTAATGGSVAGVNMRPGIGFHNPYFYGVPSYGAPGMSLYNAINCGGKAPPRLACVGYSPGPVYCAPLYQQCGSPGHNHSFRCNYHAAFGGILP